MFIKFVFERINRIIPPLTSPAMGHWGTFPPRLPTVQFIWSFQSRMICEISNWSLYNGCLRTKWIYRLVAVYSLNFIIFCVWPLNSFILLSCPSLNQILATPLDTALHIINISMLAPLLKH